MNILADDLIPAVHDAFDALGTVRSVSGRTITRDMLVDVDVLLVRSVTRVNAALLEGTPVRFVASATAGVDHIDTDWLESAGISFSAAPGSNARAVAEWVCAALLELSERCHRPLAGLTLGIIGAGMIGTVIGPMANALGMKLLLNDPPLAQLTGDPRFSSLEELVAAADVITIHTPLVTSGDHPTANLINSELLAGVKSGVWIINSSRGEVIDEQALLAARRRGHIGGLALDVFRNEPAVDVDVVAACDFATQHIAGHSRPAKLAGTRMIHDACSRWMDRQPCWTPPRPEPELIQHLDTRQSGETLVRQVVRRMIHLSALSDDFQRGIAAAAAPAEVFDRLRKSYVARRESADFAIPADIAAADAAMLAGLGFGVSK